MQTYAEIHQSTKSKHQQPLPKFPALYHHLFSRKNETKLQPLRYCPPTLTHDHPCQSIAPPRPNLRLNRIKNTYPFFNYSIKITIIFHNSKLFLSISLMRSENLSQQCQGASPPAINLVPWVDLGLQTINLAHKPDPRDLSPCFSI